MGATEEKVLTSYIHTQTDNRSFLLTYLELKDLGINNNKFFLKLYDRDLIGVNPFSNDLDEITMGKILREVVRNPWYFIREVVRLPVPGGMTRFRLHRGNLALLYLMMCNIDTIIELPRQNYKTMSAICFYLYQYEYGTTNSTFLFGNKSLEDSKLNVRRFKDIRLLMPDWLRIDNDNDVDNLTEKRNEKSNNNTILAASTAISPEQADKLGRGNTSPNQWWDEIAFLRYNKEMWGAAAPAVSQAALEAKSNGRCYGKLISTTPSNTDLPSGKFCKSLINGAAIFTEEIYDMSAEQVAAYIEANSQNDFVYIKFNYKQLRRDAHWFRQQCRALNNDMKAIRREILIEWTASSDTNPFDEGQILSLEDFMKDEIRTKMLREVYPLFIYEDIDPNVSYLVTVDVSGGLALDSSAIIFNDPVDLNTVALFKSNKIDTPELEEVLKMLVYMYPNIILIIERNSYGLSVIQHLEKDPKVKKRLFYTETKQKNAIKKVIGVNTDTKSRPLMVECFKMLVVDNPQCIKSKHIIDEVKTLEIKNGKVQHASSEHDDCVMAKAFASYVTIHWSHILKRFTLMGVKSIQRAMQRISSHNKKVTKQNLSEELIDEMQNIQIRNQQILSQRKPTELSNILSLNRKGKTLPDAIQVRPQSIDWLTDMQRKEEERKKKMQK